ncbi:hypothetical protein BgiMline_021164, partial [Biomphalaria glabrata]
MNLYSDINRTTAVISSTENADNAYNLLEQSDKRLQLISNLVSPLLKVTQGISNLVHKALILSPLLHVNEIFCVVVNKNAQLSQSNSPQKKIRKSSKQDQVLHIYSSLYSFQTICTMTMYALLCCLLFVCTWKEADTSVTDDIFKRFLSQIFGRNKASNPNDTIQATDTIYTEFVQPHQIANKISLLSHVYTWGNVRIQTFIGVVERNSTHITIKHYFFRPEFSHQGARYDKLHCRDVIYNPRCDTTFKPMGMNFEFTWPACIYNPV